MVDVAETTIRPTITRVTAFIDWNSQIYAASPPRQSSEFAIASAVLNYIGKLIGKVLAGRSSTKNFEVTLRVYHGWHKGFEVTPRKKALVQVANGADFQALSQRENVSIRNAVQFGDMLANARTARLHPKLNCHLPNTYRKSIRFPLEYEEKMVDTALASDIVDIAHRDLERWLIVIGDDDDLVPPVLVAEAVGDHEHRDVLLVRRRPNSPFLDLTGMAVRE